MMWWIIHGIAVIANALALAALGTELLGDGNLHLAAQAHPETVSALTTIFFLVWFASSFASAVRAALREDA